jgi:hypothetical protein
LISFEKVTGSSISRRVTSVTHKAVSYALRPHLGGETYININERLRFPEFDLHWEELVLISSLGLELKGTRGIGVIY